MPIIEVPFLRIAMDIIGPLERTHSGYRYILVVCDYATRYPEAFPLRRITAQSIAQALLQLISRVGIPKEIVTDQGTAFLSQTLQQVYRLLGIKGIRTTPYHPQTDGLVERYNQTLKSMLKKFVAEDGKDWDRWLPYLMFSYREVPQASTGYSPFELLYGRQVRGPLDVLRDAWEQASEPQPVPVLQYVLQMRKKMEQMAKLVHVNMEKAQVRQKHGFDKKAKARVFRPGQEVLLLLPTSDNKLLARWQGPFRVLRKMGPATYEISMPQHRRKKQTFHVNLLKEWHSKGDSVSQQLLVRSVKGEEDYTDQFLPPKTEGTPIHLDLSHLSPEKQQQLRAIVPTDLFVDRPG
uniref:Integrase catalytic domain-containing protein n=1 Tax=Paramormyrops kingsleyae TaxID=1676925 RepID=A0A3B3Q5E6_9TELE